MLRETIEGFDYKMMQNYFDELKEEEFGSLQLLDYSNEGRKIKVYGGELSLANLGEHFLDLSNFVSNFESSGYTELPSYVEYCSFDRNFNLCYVVNSKGQLAVINLDKDLVKIVEKFEPKIKIMQITGMVSTKNCSKLLSMSNVSNWRSNVSASRNCVFKMFKEELAGENEREILEFDFPHLFDSTSGCVTSFRQDTVFIIGRKDKFATLVALDFKGEDLLFQNDYMKPDEQFKFIDRMPGTNVLVLQSTFNLSIIKFSE